MSDAGAQLAARLEAIEQQLWALQAEADVRRLMARSIRQNDAGSPWGPVPSWADLSAEPDRTTQEWGWASSGMSWSGSGLDGGGYDGFNPLDETNVATMPPNGQWLPRMFHVLGTEHIEIDPTARTARGVWYSWEPVVAYVDAEPQALWVAGRFDGRFVFEDDVWRIAHLHFEEVFSTRFAGDGWVAEPHVRFGPATVADARSEARS